MEDPLGRSGPWVWVVAARVGRLRARKQVAVARPRTGIRYRKRATNPVGAARAYVAAPMCGSGTSAQAVRRCAKPFEGSTEVRIAAGERLAAAVEVLLSEGPGPCLRCFCRRHRRIQGARDRLIVRNQAALLCWFRPHVGAMQPLILDSNVAQALAWLCPFDWPTQQRGWSAE